MGMGAILGIVTWVLVGAIINSLTKDVSQSFGPATIAGFLVFAYFYYKQNKDGKGSEIEAAKKALAGPIVTSISLEQAFGSIKNILAQSHFGQNWWAIKTIEPEAGRIMALMKWREYFGDQVGELDREVVLTITLVPAENSTTEIHLEWNVHSPLNKGQANQVVQKTTEEIRNALT